MSLLDLKIVKLQENKPEKVQVSAACEAQNISERSFALGKSWHFQQTNWCYHFLVVKILSHSAENLVEGLLVGTIWISWESLKFFGKVFQKKIGNSKRGVHIHRPVRLRI